MRNGEITLELILVFRFPGFIFFKKEMLSSNYFKRGLTQITTKIIKQIAIKWECDHISESIIIRIKWDNWCKMPSKVHSTWLAVIIVIMMVLSM